MQQACYQLKQTSGLPATQAEGRDLTMAQVSAAPIDGLSIKGSIAETNRKGGDANGDDGISANLGAKYTMGQFSVGYTEGGGYQPLLVQLQMMKLSTTKTNSTEFSLT